jgi:hypothetical protein
MQRANESDSVVSPPFEPSYEEKYHWFSIGLGGKHGKVGPLYIHVDGNEVSIHNSRQFMTAHSHVVYYETVHVGRGAKRMCKKKKRPFISRWMADERMDPMFLPDEDRGKRSYWRDFGKYDSDSDCPDDIFNLKNHNVRQWPRDAEWVWRLAKRS